MNYQKKKLNKVKTGQKIWNLIQMSNYSFEEVAFALELSTPRIIYEWIKGNKLPSLENLVNISLLFNEKLENIIQMESIL